MAFKGDASQISLTNIFQTLQLQGQEGVMTVSSGKVRRKIRVLPSGLRLLALNRDNPDVLRTVLVKQKIVTESQFQNIISTMGQPGLFPGEFLIQRRILNKAQVENEVAGQLLELIYEIFSWKKAKYEFVTGDPGDDLELFQPDGLGRGLVFNVNSVLMEAARRDDDWQRIRERIASEREIYTPLDPTSFHQPHAYEGEIDDRAIQEVKSLIDGEHTLEAIVNESTLSEFEAFRAVLILMNAGEIRALTIDEKRALAEELRKKFKTQEVIDIYRNLLVAEPDDLDTRLKLVQILEKRKECAPLLTEQYQALVEHYYQAHNFAQAQGYLKLILELDHHHTFALEKMIDIYYLQKNHKEAVELARKLVDAIKAKKEFERGAEILLKVVDLFPMETFLFHELADFFIFANQSDHAVMCLKSVASLYEERGDLTRLRKTYERIVSIDPGEAHNLRKIAEVERKSSVSRRSLVAHSRRLTWMVLGVVLVLGVTYVVAQEVLVRQAYAAVQGDVKACTDAKDYARARSILADISRRHPLSSLSFRIQTEMGELVTKERLENARRETSKEKNDFQFGSYLARIEAFMSAKRFIDALALVREANQKLRETNQKQFEVYRKKLAAKETEILKYFAMAEEIQKRARDLIAAGKHEEAHGESLKILLNFPNTPASQGLKLPLLVKSTPPGAKVVLNGEVTGISPFTLFYDPLAKFNLSIDKEGFRPVIIGPAGRAIDFTRDWMVSVRLERIPAWIFNAKAPVECTPLVLGKRVYVGTRGGQIFCLEQQNGAERWNYAVPDGWDVASGIRAYKNRIAFGTFDGAFHVLDAESGRPLHRLIPFSPPRPIRHPASEPTETGTVAVNCGGAAVAGLNLVTGALLWGFRPEAEVLGSPELHRGSIVVATADGVIHLLDPLSGVVAKRIPVGARFQVQGRATALTYVVGDTAGRIRRVNLETGAVLWTYESPMEDFTPPALGGDLVFFGSRGGLIAALDLKSGDLRWRGKVNDAVLTGAAWNRGNFYLGTKSGQGLCLDSATGNPSWNFAGGGPFESAPGLGGDLVLFGCDDHRVYAFAEY